MIGRNGRIEIDTSRYDVCRDAVNQFHSPSLLFHASPSLLFHGSADTQPAHGGARVVGRAGEEVSG